MKILNAGCPRADGFYMPAEYAPHKGTIIIWPKRPGSWIYGARRSLSAIGGGGQHSLSAAAGDGRLEKPVRAGDAGGAVAVFTQAQAGDGKRVGLQRKRPGRIC